MFDADDVVGERFDEALKPGELDSCAHWVQERSEAVLQAGPDGMADQLDLLRNELAALDALVRRHLDEGRAVNDDLLMRRGAVALVLDAFEPLTDTGQVTA